MTETRAAFRAMYWLLAVAAVAALVAGAAGVFTEFRGQPVRVVTRTKPAPPIRSTADVRAHVKGNAMGADAGLPDGCQGWYAKGGAIIVCEG